VGYLAGESPCRHPAGDHEAKARGGQVPMGYQADHSALVEIFLSEGYLETAWKEAQAGG